MKSKAQFEEVHVREKNKRGEEVIRVVTKRSLVEWEVRKFYWSLYRKEETFCIKQHILETIGKVKGISESDRCQLKKSAIPSKILRTMLLLAEADLQGHFIKYFGVF